MNIYHWVFSSDKPPYASVWHSLSSIEKNENIISWLSWFIVIFLTKKTLVFTQTEKWLIMNIDKKVEIRGRKEIEHCVYIWFIKKKKTGEQTNRRKDKRNQ